MPVGDLVTALRNAFPTGGWLDAGKAACVAFLAMLCVGALLVVAAKLQNPRLGTGTGPLSVLSVIVMLALGCLGIPIRIGTVEVSALPLGALLAVGAAIAWATSKVVAGRAGVTEGALEGAKVGAPFAVLAWLAALVFRLRGGASPVAAGAGEALLLGALWGAVFGAVGGIRAGTRLSDHLLRPLHALRQRSQGLFEGVQTGTVMLALAAVGAAAAGILWVAVSLARGAAPTGFGFGDALAALVYVAAFGPNVIVALITLALGASVDVGARVRFGGRALGPLEHLSLADWGGGATPWYLWGLVLVPLVACVLGGFAARRHSAESGSRMAEVLGAAAVTFAVPLALLAWIGDARLGAGLVRARGFAQVAPQPVAVLFLALVWAAVVGFAGWKVGDTQEAPGPPRGRPEDLEEPWA